MNDPLKDLSLDCENSVNGFACSKYFNRNDSNKGFTLIEIMIVIAIIGCLSAIALPNYLKYKNNARIAVAVTDIRMIEKQIANYFVDNSQLPNNLGQLTTIGIVNDPWGNPYQYLRIDGATLTGKEKITPRKNMSDHPVNTDYDLYSMGKDGVSSTGFNNSKSRDDVVRAYEGRFVGLVSEL